MINDQIRNISHALRLFGIHGGAERRAAQAAAEGLARRSVEIDRLSGGFIV